MNRPETLAVMSVLKASYPSFYRGMTPADANGIVALWQEMFSDDEYAVVAAAVKALIACDAKGFPPHIGAVKDYIRRLTAPAERTEAEAWAIAARAVRRTDWCHPDKQFNALPEDIQAAVGSAETLVEWGKLPEETLASVAASNFQRAYRARRQVRREMEAIPASVRNAISSTGLLALGGGKA